MLDFTVNMEKLYLFLFVLSYFGATTALQTAFVVKGADGSFRITSGLPTSYVAKAEFDNKVNATG